MKEKTRQAILREWENRDADIPVLNERNFRCLWNSIKAFSKIKWREKEEFFSVLEQALKRPEIGAYKTWKHYRNNLLPYHRIYEFEHGEICFPRVR